MLVLLHETVTGEFVAELPFAKASWSSGVCTADEGTVNIPGYTGQEWWQFFIPKKYTVSISVDGVVKAAGLLGIPEGQTDDDGNHVVVFPFKGLEDHFDRRYVLPYPYWPLVNAQGLPIPARNTRITGVDYGTMIKRLYVQAMSHPGGALPVVLQPDRPGTREKEWQATAGKQVQAAVDDVSGLLGGVEWDWVPNVDEIGNLTWSLVTATDAVQEVTSDTLHLWTSGGDFPDIGELDVKVSPEFMCSTAIFAGGKEDDSEMFARATSGALAAVGVPLMEVWDSSHSSVSVQATLDGWAKQAHDDGQAPVQYWSMRVRADRAGGLRHGDWCLLDVKDHWLLPDGEYRRRILQVSGSDDSQWLGLVVGGETEW